MPKYFKSGVALAVLACISSPNVSFAQQQLEEIVVTATKRTQTLQETPVAVTVTTAETIEQAQILDVNDLQSVVPSLRINTLQSSINTNFVIRGFGNGANNPGIEPSVGVFVDGVFRSRSAGAIGDLPTLERVEVLNGPQSTLFGKNASAGVISVVTAKPSGEFGGKVSATVGNFDALVLNGEVEGAFSDTVAYKLSGALNRRDGHAENLITGGDINNRDRFNIRGDLLFTPNDNLEVRVIADFDNLNEECCATVNLVSGPTLPAINAVAGGQGVIAEDDDIRSQLTNIDPTNRQDNYGISVQVDYDFGNVALTSISSLREIDSFFNIDADFTAADLITNDVSTDIDTFTQEFRLTSTAGDKFDWQIGAYYFQEDINFEDNLINGAGFRPFVDGITFGGIGAFEAGLGLPPGSFFPEGAAVRQESQLDNEAISIFGQFDYHFTDRLTATVGFNYTTDEKDAESIRTETDLFSTLDIAGIVGAGVTAATGLTGGPVFDSIVASNPALGLTAVQFLPPFVDFPNEVESGSTDDDELTYTLRLAYQATDNINLYATYATGFKASSADLGRDSRPTLEDGLLIDAAGLGVANRTPGTRFAEPEEASVIELGAKINFARGSFNLAIFDQELENFQLNTFLGSSFTLVNAERQSTTGVEFDLTYFPTDSLKLSFGGTILDPIYDEFTQAPAIRLTADDPFTQDLSGETPAGIHEVSLNLSAAYNFNLGSNEAFVRGDFLFEDEVQIVENVSADTATRETQNLNLAAGLTTQNGYNFSIWARNVTDHETFISAFPTVAQIGSFNAYLTQPRTYGISIGKEF